MLPTSVSPVPWPGIAQVILGSKSWSRKTLLQQLQPPCMTIAVADIDEPAAAAGATSARDMVLNIAIAKALAILSDPPRLEQGRVLLLTGDAVVTHKHAILGKPASVAHGRNLLSSYGDAPVTTVSSLVVVDLTSRRYWASVDEAEVYFRPMPSHVIEQVLEDGGMQSAGALRIEHAAVKPYIECIVGDVSAVMGFSQPLCRRLVATAIAGQPAGTRLPLP